MPSIPQPQHKVQQDKAQALKAQVCELLQWTDEQYCWFQYREGLTYLRHWCDADDYAMRVLERDRHFWAWWRNLYMRLDEDFLQIHPHVPPAHAAAAYCSLHYGDLVRMSHHLDKSLVARIYKDKKLRTCKL